MSNEAPLCPMVPLFPVPPFSLFLSLFCSSYFFSLLSVFVLVTFPQHVAQSRCGMRSIVLLTLSCNDIKNDFHRAVWCRAGGEALESCRPLLTSLSFKNFRHFASLFLAFFQLVSLFNSVVIVCDVCFVVAVKIPLSVSGVVCFISTAPHSISIRSFPHLDVVCGVCLIMPQGEL